MQQESKRIKTLNVKQSSDKFAVPGYLPPIMTFLGFYFGSARPIINNTINWYHSFPSFLHRPPKRILGDALKQERKPIKNIKR